MGSNLTCYAYSLYPSMKGQREREREREREKQAKLANRESGP